MNDQEKFDEVCKWCDERRWPSSSDIHRLTVGPVWICEHSDELRKEATSAAWSEYARRTLERLINDGEAHNAPLRLRAKHGQMAGAFLYPAYASKDRLG